MTENISNRNTSKYFFLHMCIFLRFSVCVRRYVLNTSKYRSQPIESIFRLNEAICLEFERSQTIYQMLRNKRIQVASLARKIKLK